MDAAIDLRNHLPASVYALRNPEALSGFLRRRPAAAGLARAAADQLTSYFPGEPLVLDVEIDPEDAQEPLLFVVVRDGARPANGTCDAPPLRPRTADGNAKPDAVAGARDHRAHLTWLMAGSS